MVIIDASVINKLFLPNEEGYDKAGFIVQQHLQGKEKIIVPDLLFYEVANTLITKSSIPLSIALLSINDLYSFNLEIFHPSDKNMKTAASLAKKHRVSVYDASYAVLAQEKGCDLITADSKFAKQVNAAFIKTLNEYSG